MKSNRLIAYLIGSVALVLPLFVYLGYVYMLGFPDGSITELGYAERRLAQMFIGISLTFGAVFIYLGSVAAKKKIGKILSAALVFYLIFTISVVLIDYYYHLNLMGSGGG